MANLQGLCTQFKIGILCGHHNFGVGVARPTTAVDVFKAALYLASASRTAADTVYNSTGEVSGTNYVAGGVSVTNATVPAATGTTAFWTPSASIVYTNVTLSTSFDCMLLYNDTSATKLAVAVFTFGSQTITGNTFTLTMPTNNESTALLRIA
jgi:hypothetical protein